MESTEQMFRPQTGERAPRVAAPGARVKRAVQRGFTLIELMVVVSVIALSASIAFTAINPNMITNAANDFSEEITAQLIRARDQAIDDQVVVDVRISAVSLQVSSYSDFTATTTNIRYVDRADFGGNKLDGGEICILSAEPLIYAPSQGVVVNAKIPQVSCPPSGANAVTHTLIHFQPDGTYLLENNANGNYTEYGWALVVQDERAEEIEYHLIELYPTGLIRRLTDISNRDE